MSRRAILICDRCKAEAPESEWGTPTGWADADIRFYGLPKMGNGQRLARLDLCERCQDELKRVWDDWTAPRWVERKADEQRGVERTPSRIWYVDELPESERFDTARRKAERESFEQGSYERVIAERKQAEIDRRHERIAEIAKDRGQTPENEGRVPWFAKSLGAEREEES